MSRSWFAKKAKQVSEAADDTAEHKGKAVDKEDDHFTESGNLKVADYTIRLDDMLRTQADLYRIRDGSADTTDKLVDEAYEHLVRRGKVGWFRKVLSAGLHLAATFVLVYPMWMMRKAVAEDTPAQAAVIKNASVDAIAVATSNQWVLCAILLVAYLLIEGFAIYVREH